MDQLKFPWTFNITCKWTDPLLIYGFNTSITFKPPVAASRPRMLWFPTEPDQTVTGSQPRRDVIGRSHDHQRTKRISGSCFHSQITGDAVWVIEVQMKLDVCVVFLLLISSLDRLHCHLPSFTPETPQHQVGEVHAGRTCILWPVNCHLWL